MSGRKFRSIRRRKQWTRGPPAQTLPAPATQQQPEIASATAASSVAVQEPSGTPSRDATASKKKLSVSPHLLLGEDDDSSDYESDCESDCVTEGQGCRLFELDGFRTALQGVGSVVRNVWHMERTSPNDRACI